MNTINKTRLKFLPVTLLIVGVFILFQVWNPLDGFEFRSTEYVFFYVIKLSILSTLISVILINIFIKIFKPWLWLTLIYIPIAYWLVIALGIDCSGILCSLTGISVFVGRLYLVLTVLVIAITYFVNYLKTRKAKKFRDATPK